MSVSGEPSEERSRGCGPFSSTERRTPMIRKLIPFAVALALLAGACSSQDSGGSIPPDTLTTTSASDATSSTAVPDTAATTVPDDGDFPVTISAPNGSVTIDVKPERIVSISPTSSEVLFAVGAGEQVVAVDSMSNFPTNAPITDLSAFTPSVEAIASYDPDLVFLSFDPSDVVAGLEAIGIPVILHGTAISVDDAYSQWEQVGAATGHLAEAAALVAETTADMRSAFDSLPDGTTDVTYYYELDPTFYSVTSSTFIGGLIAPAGMSNIADPADADGFGFPQLNAEYIIDSNPTLIFLADTKCCGASAVTVSERPGWDTMTAVENGSVVELDDDIASRWGPRIADLVEDVVVAMLELALVDA
jgi:iron complex transport system substrate-binding protein